MKRSAFAVSVLSLIATASFAQQKTLNHAGFQVNPVNDVVYEAVSEGAHGGAAFWCAAGLYVETVLKMPAKTDIYVVRGAGESDTTGRRSAAQFTVDPAAAGVTPAPSGNDLNVLIVGEHMSAGLARNFCSSG